MAPSTARPPVDLAAANWAARIDSMVGTGVKKKTIRQKVVPIMEEDLRSVAHGAQAMPENAAILGVQASLRGGPVLQKREKDSWSPDDIFGDITKDIGDLTWRGVPALAKFAWNIDKHVADTAEVMSKGTSAKDAKWLKAHGYEPNQAPTLENLTDPAAWSQQIRNLAKTPVLGIIPGVHTAAGLTTPEGRMNLAHHPVTTALDILPWAQAGSKAAGLAGKAGAIEGSVKEAALQARPVKALYRTLPEELRTNIGKKTLAGLRKVGLDPESFGLARGLDIEGRRARAAFQQKIKDSGIIEDIARLPDEQRALLTEQAAYPDRYPDITPENQAMLDRINSFNEELAAANPNLVKVSRTSEPTTPAEPVVPVERRTIPQEGPRERRGQPLDMPEGARFVIRDAKGNEIVAVGDLGQDAALAQRTYASEISRREGSVLNIEDAEGNVIRQGQPRKPDASTGELKYVDDAEEARFVVSAPEHTSPTGEVIPERVVLRTPDIKEARTAATILEREGHGGAIINTELPKSWQKASRTVTKETVTRDYVYPADSPVAVTQKQLRAAEDSLAEVNKDVAVKSKARTIEETTRRMKEMDRRAKTVANAQRRVESAQAAVAKAQKSAETGRGKARTLDNSMTRLEKAMRNLADRRAQMEDASVRMQNPTNRYIEAQAKRTARAQLRVKERAAAFEDTFAKNPPANMVPMMERIALDKVAGRVEMQPWALDAEGKPIAGGPGSTTADYVDSALRQMERADLYQVMAPDEWQAIRREVMQTWQEVADQGYHPVWSHNVDVTRAGYVPTVRPLPSRNVRVSQVKERIGDLTPKIEDVAVSMSHAAAEYIREAATKRYMETYLVPRTKAWGAIRDFLHKEVDLMKAKGEIPRGVDEAGALQIALNKHFVEWHPDAIFETQRPKLTGTATAGETKTYLPRNLAKITEDLIAPRSQSGFVRGAAATSKLYKTSIMAFSLKHMAHILFGGTVFLGLRGGVGEIFNLPKAIKMAREGTMPVEIGRHADIWDSPDQMFQFAAGNKLGKLYEQSLGRFANAKQRFDEFVINVQRADGFLSEQGRALRAGKTATEAHEQGVQHVYKTLVDIEGMNPMERNVLRQVMPFYAFMRHTLKYILTYPIDHPMRAAILARVSDIEQTDWNSGLPDAMQTLFFLGSPNAHGDITGVEMRQFNPFRDTGSYFTLAGFMKSIHPAAQIPLTIAGMDKFTGSAELYPELEYDAQTGNLKAKRPPNSAWTAATTLVPELGLIDYFGGVTQEMRELKAKNPEAYKKRLYAMLFIPFEPKKVNVAVEAADMQQNLLKIAQQDVSNATQGGGTGQISRYPVVPYQGELVPPEQLTNVIDYIKRIRPDVAPRSALPPVKLSRL